MDAVNAAIKASQDFLTKQLDLKMGTVKAEVIGSFGEQLKGPLLRDGERPGTSE